MSLLFFDGFEGNGQVIKPEWNGTLSGSNSIYVVGNGRTGGGYLGGSVAGTLTLPASAKIILGVAVYVAAGVSNQLTIKADSGATTHLTLTLPGNGAPVLRLGTASGTILGTSSATLPGGEWHSIQVSATIADTGGRVTVKLDGTTVIDYTGDTKNAGTSTNIDTLGFVGSAGGTTSCRWDDLWVCDGVDATATQGQPNNDFLGDLKVQPMLPDGAGASTQWTPSGTGGNYAQVDEAPPNTTDYVSTSVVGNRDLYTVQDVPTNTVTVYAVRVGAYVQKSDAGAANVKTAIREPTSGTVTTSTATALSTTWGSAHSAIRCVKPSDSTLWTVADLNGLQIGVESA